MKVSLTVWLVAASLAAAPVAATAAPPLGRPFAPPAVLHGAGRVTHAFWRDHGRDHDGRRHGRRNDLVGLIGGFGSEAIGPERCSGLPVTRWDAAGLAAFLGPDFALVDARRLDHVTPRGSAQRFQFVAFRFAGEEPNRA